MRRNICIALILLTIFQCVPTYALSYEGSVGHEVKLIQLRLKRWGYYHRRVDGIFGSDTKKAVVLFQRKNDILPDGVAGVETLKKIGIAESTDTEDADVRLLARVINAEARGERYTGQVAVGAVILNRVRHESFPDTISGVVHQKGAFSCFSDGQINAAMTQSARRAAQEAMDGVDPTGGAVYYYNPDTATNKWIRTRAVIKRIGRHVFCV